MTSEAVKQINIIVAIKILTKLDCGLCTEELLIILKNLRDKCFTLMVKSLEIYGA